MPFEGKACHHVHAGSPVKMSSRTTIEILVKIDLPGGAISAFQTMLLN